MVQVNEPREKPILFSGPMVKSILAGQKTQTRRVIKAPWLSKVKVDRIGYSVITPVGCIEARGTFPDGSYGGKAIPLPWQPGDTLWVREGWSVHDHDFSRPFPSAWLLYSGAGDNHDYWWANPPEEERKLWAERFGTADTHGGTYYHKRPSIHMPRWASRITLEVIDVRAQRLQDISESDIIAEGCPPEYLLGKSWFQPLWEGINGKRPGCDWESNPWVWAISFRLLPQPARDRARGIG